MEPLFSWHSHPPQLSPGHIPQPGSLFLLHCACVLALSLKFLFHVPRMHVCVLSPAHQLSHHAICHQSPEFKPHSSSLAQTLPHMQVDSVSSQAQLVGSREQLRKRVLPLQERKWLQQQVAGEATLVCSLCNFNFNIPTVRYLMMCCVSAVFCVLCGSVSYGLVNVGIKGKWFTPPASLQRHFSNWLLNYFI